MDWWVLAIVSVLALLLFMGSGVPIAFSLGFLAMIGLWLLWPGPAPLQVLATTSFSVTANFVLVAVPLFILMAEVVLFSGMSDDAFDAIHKWMGWMPGGLAVSSIGACAAFAAITGSSIANTVTIGLVAVPEMLNRGYDKKLAPGAVAAGGALGILIPPSIVMILYGIMAEESIGKLFFGGFVPGIITAIIFVVYIMIRCAMNPALAPKLPSVSWRDRLGSLWKVWGVVVLALAVLGSIYTGICTPTEAAGIGAAGAFLLAIVYRKLNWTNLRAAILRTAQTTSMILIIFIGGMAFSHVMAFLEIPQNLTAWIGGLPVNRWLIMAMMNFMLLCLGCVIDPGSIVIILTPIFLPVILALGFDPVWFGVVFTMNMEMANITPPLGYNLYVMKGIVPEDVSMADIIRGILPFVALYALTIVIVMVFPQLILWLPNQMITR
jgi:tripartite ATP-independent transporter DctM subunit